MISAPGPLASRPIATGAPLGTGLRNTRSALILCILPHLMCARRSCSTGPKFRRMCPHVAATSIVRPIRIVPTTSRTQTITRFPTLDDSVMSRILGIFGQ
ncbi:hypothetical protein KY49_6940 [Burkholderia sp. MSHR3999]|nr:hypothetical protein KY49_6940 [Burkholderia sp. MSHR3999]